VPRSFVAKLLWCDEKLLALPTVVARHAQLVAPLASGALMVHDSKGKVHVGDSTLDVENVVELACLSPSGTMVAVNFKSWLAVFRIEPREVLADIPVGYIIDAIFLNEDTLLLAQRAVSARPVHVRVMAWQSRVVTAQWEVPAVSVLRRRTARASSTTEPSTCGPMKALRC